MGTRPVSRWLCGSVSNPHKGVWYIMVMAERDSGGLYIRLDPGKRYVLTKWYGRSLALFREETFRKYLGRLAEAVTDEDNRRSIIRYFLTAAHTVVGNSTGRLDLPKDLSDYIYEINDPFRWAVCPQAPAYSGTLPEVLIASRKNLQAAVDMTKRRHA